MRARSSGGYDWTDPDDMDPPPSATLQTPRTDYAANRGPLDRREYVRRTPDPFSVAAGCLTVIMSAVIMLVVLATVGGIVIGAIQHALS